VKDASPSQAEAAMPRMAAELPQTMMGAVTGIMAWLLLRIWSRAMSVLCAERWAHVSWQEAGAPTCCWHACSQIGAAGFAGAAGMQACEQIGAAGLAGAAGMQACEQIGAAGLAGAAGMQACGQTGAAGASAAGTHEALQAEGAWAHEALQAEDAFADAVPLEMDEWPLQVAVPTPSAEIALPQMMIGAVTGAVTWLSLPMDEPPSDVAVMLLLRWW
jgi:hypothetical protein